MHQALYRKYRPRTFDGEGGVTGQDPITSVLKYESEHGKFSHAYLFCGPRGTGKTSCAKILAKAINCEHPVGGNPCGECDACRAIDEGRATDVLEMDAASNNGVDYIRDIRDAVNFAPAALKKRVYIIDEVHMLSVSAFNALLKTLEEPPEHVVFILATTEFHKLPATIVSRCQRFDFRRIRSEIIAERLLYIAGLEGISLDPAAAATLAKQSQGGMRDAISLFELTAAGGHDVTPERVAEILGLAGIETQYKTAFAVAKNDPAAIFRIVAAVDSSSKDIAVYWGELIGFWRDMLIAKTLPDEEKAAYLDYTEPEMRLLSDGARRFSREALSAHFRLMDDALREMTRLPQTKRLTAELTLLRMADASLDVSPQAMLARLASLEEKLALIESGIPVTPSAPAVPEPVKEAADEEKPDEEPAEVPAPKDEGFTPVDLSDVTDRVRGQNPPCASFLANADCVVSADRLQVKIAVGDILAMNWLERPDSQQSIQSALRICGVTEPGATITVTLGAAPREKAGIDELAEY